MSRPFVFNSSFSSLFKQALILFYTKFFHEFFLIFFIFCSFYTVICSMRLDIDQRINPLLSSRFVIYTGSRTLNSPILRPSFSIICPNLVIVIASVISSSSAPSKKLIYQSIQHSHHFIRHVIMLFFRYKNPFFNFIFTAHLSTHKWYHTKLCDVIFCKIQECKLRFTRLSFFYIPILSQYNIKIILKVYKFIKKEANHVI